MNETETLSCYTKLFPKWVAYAAIAVGIAVVYFLSFSSWVTYLWIFLCTLMVVKIFTQKPETKPVVVVGETGIQLNDSKFYPYQNIEKVMAYSKNKFKFRSVSFKLFLNNHSQVEFSVDDLNVKPQRILDAINAKIKK